MDGKISAEKIQRDYGLDIRSEAAGRPAPSKAGA
jgi:hypothetical protein